MKDDLLRRLRQKVVRTDNNGQSYPASRNIDGDEAADEIERLIAELAAERDMSFAYKRHLLAEEKTSSTRGAFLLAERERAKAAEAERDTLRAELAAYNEQLSAIHVERANLRAELAAEREARSYVQGKYAADSKLAFAIDAALNKEGE
jgi:hypothetical protein